MKYILHLNQLKSIEWGLTSSEMIVFGWLYELPSWAESVIIQGKPFYFASRNKAEQELPILKAVKNRDNGKRYPDTFYRYYKALRAKGLINWNKVGDKDYIAITAKGKEWYFSKESEVRKEIRTPEIFPNQPGNNSEPTPDLFPTNKDISFNKDTNDKAVQRHVFESIEDIKNEISRLGLHENTVPNRMKIWDLFKPFLKTDDFKNQWEFLTSGLPYIEPTKMLKVWVRSADYYKVKTLQINKIQNWVKTELRSRPQIQSDERQEIQPNGREGGHSGQTGSFL